MLMKGFRYVICVFLALLWFSPSADAAEADTLYVSDTESPSELLYLRTNLLSPLTNIGA